MLCLNRLVGQRIIMRVGNGPVIIVNVLRSGKGGTVRLGIDAPRGLVSVDREEVDASKQGGTVEPEDKQSFTRSIVRLWKALGEPVAITDDSLIRQASFRINELARENAALRQRLGDAPSMPGPGRVEAPCVSQSGV